MNVEKRTVDASIEDQMDLVLMQWNHPLLNAFSYVHYIFTNLCSLSNLVVLAFYLPPSFTLHCSFWPNLFYLICTLTLCLLYLLRTFQCCRIYVPDANVPFDPLSLTFVFHVRFGSVVISGSCRCRTIDHKYRCPAKPIIWTERG